MSWSSFLRAPAWLYALALFALGAAVGLMGKRLGMDANPAVAAVVLGLLVVIAVGGTVLYWRRLDEAAREAHKFAWYWGGSLGLGASVLLVNALQAMGADPLSLGGSQGSQPADFFNLGVLWVVLGQLAGYVVAWAGWWIARR